VLTTVVFSSWRKYPVTVEKLRYSLPWSILIPDAVGAAVAAVGMEYDDSGSEPYPCQLLLLLLWFLFLNFNGSAVEDEVKDRIAVMAARVNVYLAMVYRVLKR